MNLGYLWSFVSIAACTGIFSVGRPWLDKGQASLLYLPVVITCAVYFGFGPALLAAILSFTCWDFFFLPPSHTFGVTDPKDWLSLVVFLVAAVTTARLASRAREQAAQAESREAEIAALFEASETLSREVDAERLIAVLSRQVRSLCQASDCIVWRTSNTGTGQKRLLTLGGMPAHPESDPVHRQLAEAALEHGQTIGFDSVSKAVWGRAMGKSRDVVGAYIPLQVESRLVGVLNVGQRTDGAPFSELDQRLILTLANHVAVVIAREALAEQAAQAEALREADQLKDSLLSMVSHELRSPLSAIKVTATGLMSETTDPGRVATELQAINVEADRLSAIVSNLLDLSRLEANSWKPEKDWCDIGEIVATALDRLPPDGANRVDVLVAADLPLIKADYTQIALVLTNLLQNAVKYTEAGSIQLCAAESPNDQGSEASVLIRIRDYGAGITSGDEEMIFARFYRSTVHHKGKVGGTGLGLALCEAIVRAHDGRIWAGNAPAGEASGAIFSVSLPVEHHS